MAKVTPVPEGTVQLTSPQDWLLFVDRDQPPDPWGRIRFTAFYRHNGFGGVVSQRIFADLDKFMRGHPREWPVRVVYT